MLKNSFFCFLPMGTKLSLNTIVRFVKITSMNISIAGIMMTCKMEKMDTVVYFQGPSKSKCHPLFHHHFCILYEQLRISCDAFSDILCDNFFLQKNPTCLLNICQIRLFDLVINSAVGERTNCLVIYHWFRLELGPFCLANR